MTRQTLKQLRERYASNLPDRLEELRVAMARAAAASADSPEVAKAMALAHRLAGTAGTYGFLNAAELAIACESVLEKYRTHKAAIPTWENLLTKFLHLHEVMPEQSIQILEKALPDATTGNKERILVIDDEDDFLAIIAGILEQSNYVPITRNHTRGLKELLETTQPEVILLDIEMPETDGFQVCRAIKGFECCQETPIIFLTNRNTVHDRIAAFSAGGDDFINKPIVAEELLARVDIRIEKTRVTREREALLMQVENHRDSLLALLDQLQIGSMLLNPDGRVTFVSCYCSKIGLELNRGDSLFWQEILPLDSAGQRCFQEQLALAADKRRKLALSWSVAHCRYFVDCEINDVPGTESQQIVYLTDVSELRRLQQQLEESRYGRLIGNSLPMRELYRLIGEVARGDWTVLIEGETGGGKELVAHSIHANSPRNNGPFITVNSAGLSESLLASQLFGHRKGAFTGAVSDQEGYFEAAHGGTLFLDEIGDLPLNMQASLLRVLQDKKITRVGETRERKVDVRILAATHKDLNSEVREGRFRQDLFYRLRVGRICVPSLREHKSDIPLLVEAFIEESDHVSGRARPRVGNEAMQALLSYDWPGNVRELKAVIDYAVIHSHGEEIQCDDFPSEISLPVKAHATDLPELLAGKEDERTRILEALEKTGGNRLKAAKLLGISRATFYRRIAKFGIIVEP